VIQEGQNGYLVPAGDSTLMAQRITRLLDNVRLRETMGMSGYFRVRDRFTFDAQARQYGKLFRELLYGAAAEEVYTSPNSVATNRPIQEKDA
jgi:N,N'-diacetylbacillosaminyl-diphospho-undecaprenol alpha-1,3-N-acetylgalactosaminyltransferase